jgi:DNA polymerase-4
VGRTVSIKVRNSNFETVTRSVTLRSPVSGSKEIYDAAWELFQALTRVQSIRLLGVRIENLEDETSSSFQDTLMDSVTGARAAQSQSERVMDEIRAKFGQRAIERAAQSGIRLSRLK